MNALIVALLAVAWQLPAQWVPPHACVESPAERADRIEMVVVTSVRVSRMPPENWPGTADELAAALLATTYAESRWAFDVHAGYRRGDSGRACGLGQCWDCCDTVGLEPKQTRRHLEAVARHLAFHARRCRVRSGRPEDFGKISAGYLTGDRCDPTAVPPTRARIRLYRRFRQAVPRGPVRSAVALLRPP